MRYFAFLLMRSFWTPVRKGMYIRIPRLRTEKKAFTVNRKNIKQKIAIKMTFILEVSFKSIFLSKYDHFSICWCMYFEHILGWECAYLCHNPRTEKEDVYDKYREHKTSKGIEATFTLEFKLQSTFFIRIGPFFQQHMHIFWTTVRMGMCIRMPQLKNWKTRDLR